MAEVAEVAVVAEVADDVLGSCRAGLAKIARIQEIADEGQPTGCPFVLRSG